MSVLMKMKFINLGYIYNAFRKYRQISTKLAHTFAELFRYKFSSKIYFTDNHLKSALLLDTQIVMTSLQPCSRQAADSMVD